MAYTYAELKIAIQDYSENDEATFVTHLDDFIRSAEERILKESQLQVFRKNATANVVAGNKYLPKPLDWLFSYSLSVTDGVGGHVFLLNKDVNFIQDYWPAGNSATNTPKYYADYDVDNFILAPTPAAADTAELHYFYRPASLTAGVDSGTTWLSVNAAQALLYACLVEAYTYMKGEVSLLQVYDSKYMEMLDRLKNLGEAREVTDVYRGEMKMREPT